MYLPRYSKTVAVLGSYTAIDHKVTVVNGPSSARLVATVLRPLFDATYSAKSSQKQLESLVFNRLRDGKIRRNTVTTKGSFAPECV